jgi:arylsulfatase A-like enzyme
MADDIGWFNSSCYNHGIMGPRGVLKCKATDKDDPTVDPYFGKVGKQTIENTGPLPKERMESVDEEFLTSALDFIDRKTKEGGPWFCYFNPTRMHIFTHLKPSSVGKTGLGLYPDGMVELDGYVGQLLKKLDDLKVADNTIVVFTTDNGAEVMSWPDGGATPFRGEKDTNWEGGWRVPCVMRWPGVSPAASSTTSARFRTSSQPSPQQTESPTWSRR